MKRMLLVLLACLTLNSCAIASTVRITDDRGGVIGNYIHKYKKMRANGTRLMIDGYCASACTAFIGNIPRDHVCLTNRAYLGFHGAWIGLPFAKVEAPGGTKLLLENYNEPIREWIRNHGGIETYKVMRILKYPETMRYFSAC